MERPENGVRLRSSARSDRGRVRQNNEDHVHLWAQDHDVLAVVADGMGGAVAGEEASRIAIETIHDKFSTATYRKPDDYQTMSAADLADLLDAAVRDANLSIIQRVDERPELKGMGTTLTLAFARGQDVILAHVGDSRAYIVDGDDGSIQQITDDHSFVQALLDAGHITEAEAATHPMKNVLYRALGQAEDLDVDLYEDVYMHVGDRLVLCSDGLTLHVTSEEIAEVAMLADDPNIISDHLIELANKRGGKDNISVIVVIAEEDITTASDTGTASDAVDAYAESGETIPIAPGLSPASQAEPALPQATPDMPPDGSVSRRNRVWLGEGRDSHEPLQ